MINRSQYRKLNEKKILRKKGKKWITVSSIALSLLIEISGTKALTSNAHAQAPVVNGQSGRVNPSKPNQTNLNLDSDNNEDAQNLGSCVKTDGSNYDYYVQYYDANAQKEGDPNYSWDHGVYTQEYTFPQNGTFNDHLKALSFQGGKVYFYGHAGNKAFCYANNIPGPFNLYMPKPRVDGYYTWLKGNDHKTINKTVYVDKISGNDGHLQSRTPFYFSQTGAYTNNQVIAIHPSDLTNNENEINDSGYQYLGPQTIYLRYNDKDSSGNSITPTFTQLSRTYPYTIDNNAVNNHNSSLINPPTNNQQRLLVLMIHSK